MIKIWNKNIIKHIFIPIVLPLKVFFEIRKKIINKMIDLNQFIFTNIFIYQYLYTNFIFKYNK